MNTPGQHIDGMVRAYAHQFRPAANIGGPPVPITETMAVRVMATNLCALDDTIAAQRQRIDQLEAEVTSLRRQLREADGALEENYWRSLT